MKKFLIAISFVTCGQISFSQTIVNLNFWQISTNSTGLISYPGHFSNSIKPFDSFLNSVSRNENGLLETYTPNSSTNSFEVFEPGKSYIFNLKQEINVIHIPAFDRLPSTTLTTGPWFIFPGTSTIEISNFDEKIHVVYRYDNPSSGLRAYMPGDMFNLMTTFEPGGRYLVDNNNQEFLVPYSVPEPSAFSLLAVGLGGLAMMRRSRKRD